MDRKRFCCPLVGESRITCRTVLDLVRFDPTGAPRGSVFRPFVLEYGVLRGIRRELSRLLRTMAWTGVIAGRAAKCIYIPSLGQSPLLCATVRHASETFAAPLGLLFDRI